MNIKPLMRALLFFVSALLVVGTFSQVAAQGGRDRTAPSTPTGLTSSNVQMTQVTVSWTASTDNVGVTGYIIRRNGTQVGTVGAVTTFTNTGLTPNTAYSYTVTAQDAAGNTSAASTALNVTTLADTVAPSVPTGLASSNVQATQATITWSASTDNAAVTNYVIKRNGTIVGTVGAVTTFTNTGLTGSTTYQYTVAARDASGNTSADSAVLNVTTAVPPDTTAPTVPTNLTSANIQMTQATLNWTASTDNVGVTNYIVRRGGTIVATLGNVTTYTDTGLASGTTYSYTVAARDLAGNTSAASTALNVTTLADTVAPTTPTGLTSSNVLATQATLNWTASTDNVAVTAYIVRRNGTIIATLGNVTTYTNTGLTPSTAYFYTVTARDAAGNTSAASSTLNVSTPADTTAPTTPSNLTSSNLQAAQVTLSWTASTDNIAVSGYTVNRNGVAIATVTTTSYTNTGLTPATAYSYTVVAKDAAGNTSTASNTVNVTTLADTAAPTVPTGLAVTKSVGDRVDLSWTASTDNVGVTNYVVRRGTTVIATIGAVTTYSDTTVSPLTSYSYSVAARDAKGNTSVYSTAVNTTTPALDTVAPSAPASLRATSIQSGQIVLRWNASTDNVAVTNYTIRRNGLAVATVGAVVTYTDVGLTPLTAYQYTVVALDAVGNTSASSNTLNATTLADTTAPSAPGGLTLSGVQFTQVTLTWTASTDNVGVTNYLIRRNGVTVATIGAVLTYTDTGLTPGTLYSYTVAAKDAAGNISANSITRSATTTADTIAPTAPSGVATSNVSAASVTLNWAAAVDNVGVTNYVVNRDGVAIATVGAVTTYTDTNVTIASSYSYTVAAKDAAGNTSAVSNTATATIPSSPCTTSGPAGGSYTITVCLVAPTDSATLTGSSTITTSVSFTGSPTPAVGTLLYSLNGQYLLTDFNNPKVAPTTFQLPTTNFVDGTYSLSVVAGLSDTFTTAPAGIRLTFANGVVTAPSNPNTFAPYKPAVSGRPLVLAATGDGADGQSPAVPNRIASWNPDMFLYLGDVYNKGTLTEFQNWYGTNSTFFSQFNNITNPIVGNHEYEQGIAPGYYDYWNMGPATTANEPRSYYSYNAGGWHFIALNSNQLHNNYLDPGSAEYTWLANDLAANTAVCTIAYFHHPPFNVGPEGYYTKMNAMWDLMAQNGVDVVLTGHDHDYQRWQPLGVGGVPSPTGITEFVAGGGGHGTQQPITTDSRLVTGAYTTPSAYGALRMELNATGMQFQYINQAGSVLDSGAIPCNGTTDTIAPSVPTNLTATSGANVVLNWTGSTDATGIAGYTIYRDGVALTTTVPGVTSYTDYAVQLGHTYSYTVDAFDPSGNHSAQSGAAPATTPISATYVLNPIADGYVNDASPTFNFGASTALRTDLSPVQNTYLRFNLPALSGNVIDATLRVYSNNTGNELLGYTVSNTAGGWTETDLTFGTAPAAGTIIGSSGPFTRGGWTTVNVTSAITAAGDYNLVMTANGNTANLYDSREATNPPQLVITVTSDSVPPTAPSGLATTDVQGTQVSLSWTGSTDNIGVTNYVINRNGIAVATIGPVTTYTDAGLAPGTAYQYTVSAKDAAGNISAPSNAVDVTTSSLGTLTVVTTADSYTNSDLPTSNFGNTASLITDLVPVENGYLRFVVPTFAGQIANAKFQVFANSASSAGYTLFSTASGWTETGINAGNAPAAGTSLGSSGTIALGTWTTVDVTSLVTAAGEYNFMMMANSNTQTSYSSRTGANAPRLVITLKTDFTAPSAPTNLTVSGVQETQVTLNWDAASDNVGVTGYVINRNGVAVGTVGPVLTYTDTGLTASTLYHYTVVAMDGALNPSVPSNQVDVTTPDVTAPAAPAGLTGLTQANKVILSWAAATDNVAVTGYTISRDGTVLGSVGAVTTYTDLTALPDTTYQYTVTAQDAAANVSLPSAPLSITPLSAASNLTATGVQPTQATLNWTASTSPAVTGYIINRDGATIATVGAVTTYTDLTLTADSLYQYTVIAQSASGDTAAASNIITVDTHQSGSITLNPVADTYVDSNGTGPFGTGTVLRTSSSAGASTKNSYLRFQVPAYAGNVTSVTLRVYANSASGAGYTLSSTSGGWTETGLIYTNQPPIGSSLGTSGAFALGDWTTINLTPAVLNGGEYNFVMTGNNGTSVSYSSREGANKPELVITLSNDIVPPTAPANLTTANVQETQLDLNWDASTDNIGVTGYIVKRGGVIVATLGTVNTYTDTGLTAGTAYSYTVNAVDAAGNLSLASSVNVTTADVTAPTAPTNVAASGVQGTQATLTWTAATDNVAVTNYVINRDGVAIATVGAVLTYTDTGLTQATAYTYTIAAKDAAGNTSVVSDPPVSVTTGDTTAPTAPTNLAASSVQPTQVVLGWTASTDNIAVTGYTVNRNGAVLATGVTTATYTDTTVAADTAYTYTVSAQDAANNSSPVSKVLNVNTTVNGSITLPAVADSSVDPATPDGNFGTNASLRADSRSSYLRFTMPALGTNIVSAKLRVYLNSGSAVLYTVYTTDGLTPTLNTPWTEGTITFNTKPAPGTLLGGPSTIAVGTYTETEVKTALTNGAGDYNFVMIGGTTSQTNYASREAAANQPQLLLTLSGDSTPPTAPTLTGNAQGTQVTLNWSGATDNVGVIGYTVKRDGLTRASLAGTAATYTEAVTVGTTYNYTVIASDAAGLSSPASNTFTVTPLAAPTGLVASNVTQTSLTLNWNASAGATNYVITRNGAALPAVVTGTTYNDTGLTAGTAYAYTVTAKDAAGNTSAASAVLNQSTQGAAQVGTITRTPVIDSYIDSSTGTAGTNFGTITTIRTGTSSTSNKSSYLQFTVPTLGGSVVSATLRVFVNPNSGTGTTSSQGYLVWNTVTGWTETGITYNNAPATVGGSVGASGAFVVPANTGTGFWTTVNVTSAVTGAGEYNFVLTANGATQTAVTYSSRTGANPPELVIQINTPPVAVNDSGYSVVQGNALTVSVGEGVLVNDTDVDAGTTLTAVKVADPAHGTINLNANGSFTYTPAAGYVGSDSFTYKANDGKNDSNVATVSINVTNTAPVAVDDSGYSTNQDTALTVPVGSGVLVNDSDVDGNSLTASLVADAAHGTVALIPNGAFTYTPAAGYAGSDSFTYKAYDGAALSNLATVSITVNAVLPPAPTAAFTSDVSSGTAPLSVTFTNASSGSITGYSWDFGDGSAADTSTNPTHSFAAEGSYTVILTASGPGGSNTASATITVSAALPPAPTASFTASPISGTAPLTVTFTNTSTGSISGSTWNFGDGSPLEITTDAAHTFAAAGTYTVTLTVSGPGGIDSTTATIIVSAPLPPAPTASFTPDVSSGAAPLTVTFTNTSSGSISGYSWNFGDGSAADTSLSPTHTFAAEGTYTVVLTVSGPGGTDTASATITVSTAPPPAPTASFTSSVTSGTAPLDVTFTNTSTGSVIGYSWDFGDGSAADTSVSPTHTYNTAGVYTVTLTVDGTVTATDTITVN